VNSNSRYSSVSEEHGDEQYSGPPVMKLGLGNCESLIKVDLLPARPHGRSRRRYITLVFGRRLPIFWFSCRRWIVASRNRRTAVIVVSSFATGRHDHDAMFYGKDSRRMWEVKMTCAVLASVY
jgi:hypothetical protein